jgi:hypothetical protein
MEQMHMRHRLYFLILIIALAIYGALTPPRSGADAARPIAVRDIAHG